MHTYIHTYILYVHTYIPVVFSVQKAACELARGLMTTASKVKEYLSMDEITDVDEHNSFYQSTMHACFNLGFEVLKYVHVCKHLD